MCLEEMYRMREAKAEEEEDKEDRQKDKGSASVGKLTAVRLCVAAVRGLQ